MRPFFVLEALCAFLTGSLPSGFLGVTSAVLTRLLIPTDRRGFEVNLVGTSAPSLRFFTEQKEI